MTLASSAASASSERSPRPGVITGTRDRRAITARGLLGWWQRNTREMRWSHWLADVAVAVFLEALVGFPFVMLASSRTYFEPLLLPSWILYLAALVLRRYSPKVSLALCLLAIGVKMSLGMEPHGQDVAVFVVLYSAAAYGAPFVRWSSLALCGVLPAVLIVAMLNRRPRSVGWLEFHQLSDSMLIVQIILGVVIWFAIAFVLLLCWLAGQMRRTQQRAEDSAHERRLAELEHLRSREQLFVEQERNRIARDMHDVVAHSLAVVVAQADGGRYAMKTNPQIAEESLGTIAETAREALVEVRSLLGQLRHSQPEGPQRGFADVPAVLERMRAAGLQIAVESSGTPQTLGRAADNAMFRLVQESLTNALRHGDPKVPVVVTVQWGPELHVAVRNALNPTPPPPRPDSGHGLIGMRERIVTAGGRLETGKEQGWFVVRAAVPTAALNAQNQAKADAAERRAGAEALRPSVNG